MNALIAEARKKYHKELLSSGVMTIDSKGIPSNADSSSKLSINIAHGIADQLMAICRHIMCYFFIFIHLI